MFIIICPALEIKRMERLILKTMTLTGDHTLTGYENLAGYHIEGNCLEREGIFDGDIILVDFEKCPRPLSDGVRDICLCYASAAPIGRQKLMAKVYTGSRNGHHMGTTAYSEQPDREVNISRVLGVVAAVFTPKGEFKREWDTSDCPTELASEETPSTAPGTVQLQVLRFAPGFLDTIEGCRLINVRRDIYEAARSAFKELSREEQRRMMFTPNAIEEWDERREFWARVLGPTMTVEQFTVAMDAITEWYAHCLTLRESEEGGQT